MINQTTNGDDLTEYQKDWPSILIISSYLSILSVVGTIGNAFVLYVFSRKKDKSPSTVFILALASIDFVTCIIVIPFTIVMEFMFKRVHNDLVCKIYQFFITSNVPFSAFIMTAIAFDRYFCICRPWMRWLDIKFAKIIICMLLVFSLMLGLVTSLAYGVYHVKNILNKVKTPQANGVLNYTLEQILSANISKEAVINTGNCSLSWHEDSASLRNCRFQMHAASDTPSNASTRVNDLVFTGFCFPNELIISSGVRKIYQKFYASLYLIAFIIVVFLYALIYRSILTRRSKKLQTLSAFRGLNGRSSALLTSILTRTTYSADTMSPPALLNNENLRGSQNGIESCPDVSTSAKIAHTTESSINVILGSMFSNEVHKQCMQNNVLSSNGTAFSQLDPPHSSLRGPVGIRNKICKSVKINNCIADNQGTKHISLDTELSNKSHLTTNHQHDCVKLATFNIYRKDTRKSIREKHRLANIKTAGILFIVTVVFVIAFLPAWLMATKLIPPNMIVFYTYFIYNVANPVIYAFFNQTFQKEMKVVLNCGAIPIPFR